MKEWNQVGEEYSRRQEWENAPKQYRCPMPEYSPLPKEHSVPPKEYVYISEEKKETHTEANLRKTRKKKLLKKMSYMVAATVSVVVMGKTIEMEPEDVAPVIPEESVAVQGQVTNGLPWPEVSKAEELLGEEAEEGRDVAGDLVEGNKEAPPLIYTGDFESYGWANGGVIPIKKDGLWGLIDYEGNEVLKPSYESFWLSPNDDGYTIFSDEDGYYIVGPDGGVREYDPEVYRLQIGEENIVSYYLFKEDGEKMQYRYEKLDGTVLHELESMVDVGAGYFSAFHEGKAYAFCIETDGTEWGNRQLIELSSDGTSRVVMDAEELEKKAEEEEAARAEDTSDGLVDVNIAGESFGFDATVFGPNDGYEGGVFVGSAPGYGGGWHLVDPNDGYFSGRMIAVTFEDKGLDFEQNITLKAYRSNGVDMLHHMNYGCMTVTTEDGQSKDYLFDYWDCIGEELTSYLACYDTIVLDDFDVLLAKDGDEYFYTTIEGGKWIYSKNYYKATPFNNARFAMVMKEDGVAEVIYMDCYTEEVFKGVSNVGICDQVFEITFTEENEWGLEPGTYLYTEYSPK